MTDAEDLRVVLPRDVITKKADSRGRINLGSEYAGDEVTVAVVEVDD